jgi:hypothetical protein
MLQLLLERGQSYADLASVLGVGESEVRARARAALTELAGVDPDRNVGVTDYLLGQADPIGRADVVRHLKDHPDELDLVSELSQKLRLLAPEAELPRLPGEERQPRPRRARRLPSRLPLPDRWRRREAAAEVAGTAAQPPRGALSRRQTQLMVGLGSVAVLVIVVVLAATGAFSGDDGGGAPTTPTNPDVTEELTRVRLQPQGGGSGNGQAVFGLASGDQPFVDLSLSGLEPAPQGQTYVVWLLLAPEQGYPLSPINVAQNGSFNDRFAIPSLVVPIVARVQFVDVSVAPVNTIRNVIQAAIEKNNVVVQRPGTSVLRGRIPRTTDVTGQGQG